jgi:hypothetical protein
MDPRYVIANRFALAKWEEGDPGPETSLGDFSDADDLMVDLTAAGYAIVPVEPTDEMCERYVSAWKDEWSGLDAQRAKKFSGWGKWPVGAREAQRRCIKVMLQAAPEAKDK